MTQSATSKPKQGGSVSDKRHPSADRHTFLQDTQVAQRYGVSRVTVWRWVKNGSGFPPPIKLSDAVTRWKLADLEEWEAVRATA